MKNPIKTIFSRCFGQQIAVVGIGGCGSNMVNYVARSLPDDADFIVCDSDKQALGTHESARKFLIDRNIDTRMECSQIVSSIIKRRTKVLIISAGLGGMTGTSGIVSIAETAKQRGLLTIGVFTLPFPSEGQMFADTATQALSSLKSTLDGMLILDNGKMAKKHSDCKLFDFFNKSNTSFTDFVRCIIAATRSKNGMDVLGSLITQGKELVIGIGRTDSYEKMDIAISDAVSAPEQYCQTFESCSNLIICIACGAHIRKLIKEDRQKIDSQIVNRIGICAEIKMLSSMCDGEIDIFLLGTKV